MRFHLNNFPFHPFWLTRERERERGRKCEVLHIMVCKEQLQSELKCKKFLKHSRKRFNGALILMQKLRGIKETEKITRRGLSFVFSYFILS